MIKSSQVLCHGVCNRIKSNLQHKIRKLLSLRLRSSEEKGYCKMKFVVVTGGVLSGIGKGITISSIGYVFILSFVLLHCMFMFNVDAFLRRKEFESHRSKLILT